MQFAPPLRFLAALCALAALGGWPVRAAQQQFRAATDTVDVHATVKLRTGTLAHDLTREDFTLFEDGQEREISVFSRSIQPLSVSLVLDHSGSTQAEFQNVQLAAQEFVGRLLPGDRAAISTLTWDCQSFTADSRDMMMTLRRDLPTDFGSPVWAATDRAMAEVALETNRRIVLLFSDGEDNQTVRPTPLVPVPPTAIPDTRAVDPLNPCRHANPENIRTIDDVITRAEREAVMVYAVSVDTAMFTDQGPKNLTRLAKQSGAAYQRLGKYSEVKSAFRGIVDELHLQYLIGFVPSFTDGKRHEIEVRVKRPGVTVQARKAYIAQSGK